MRILVGAALLLSGCVDEQQAAACSAACAPYLVLSSDYQGKCLCDMRCKQVESGSK
jgi:hypothetical protein